MTTAVTTMMTTMTIIATDHRNSDDEIDLEVGLLLA
jgi:hypothetical protein